MTDATTPNYGWSYPTFNADADTWGTTQNTTVIAIDAQMKTVADAAAAAQSTADGALVASNNLSDLSSASAARTNIGLVIGTDVQAHNAKLDTFSGLTGTAGHILYFGSTATPAELSVGSGLSISGGTITAAVTSVAGRTGDVVIAHGDVSGLGSLAVSSNSNALNAGSNALGNVTISTSGPSGTPADGDRWVQHA